MTLALGFFSRHKGCYIGYGVIKAGVAYDLSVSLGPFKHPSRRWTRGPSLSSELASILMAECSAARSRRYQFYLREPLGFN